MSEFWRWYKHLVQDNKEKKCTSYQTPEKLCFAYILVIYIVYYKFTCITLALVKILHL